MLALLTATLGYMPGKVRTILHAARHAVISQYSTTSGGTGSHWGRGRRWMSGYEIEVWAV